MRIDWKDVGKRAGKTFVQAFGAAIVVHMDQITGIRDWESAKAIALPIVVGGVAAGVSAIWNMLEGYLSQRESEVE